MSQNQPDQRYHDLALKWVNETISDEELDEYINWLNRIDTEEELIIPHQLAADRDQHKTKIYNEITRRLSKEAPRPARYRFMHTWQSAAVIMGLFLTGGLTYMLTHTGKPPASLPAPAVVASDIEPGVTGAVLRLANGKVIVLDTAANGNLEHSIMKSSEAVVFEPAPASDSAQYNTLSTPRARQQQLVLPDGSRVWLNAESSIRFPSAFDGKIRKVEITGEAYMEVSPDKIRPFIVDLNQSSITVLGTHFNVMAYPEETHIETTLLEGSVKFQTASAELLLRPGQQSRFSYKEANNVSSSKRLALDRNPDLESVMAWKNGFQSFKNADLSVIFRQITRWYDVEVEYEGSLPADISFSGQIPREVTLKQLLQALQSDNLHFDLDAPHRKLHVHFESSDKKS